MGLLRLVAPTTFPVGVDEVRARLKIDDEDDDEIGLKRLIAAATRVVENRTQRALITQKWKVTLDAFPCGAVIQLPRPPLLSVESIKYIDLNGVEQTLSSDDYVVDTSTYIGTVYPAYGKSWPSTRSERQAVRITFFAGYGGAVDVEPDLVLAILFLVAHYKQNVEAVSDRQMYVLPEGVESILSGYVVPSAP